MPTLLLGKRNVLDEFSLARIIDARAQDIDFAYLEYQWPRPTDGGVQAFKTGVGYGMLRMLLTSNFIPYRVVSPQTWRRALKLTGDKDSSRALASQLLPHDAHQWGRKKDDGRAEATLIALYGLSHPIIAEAA
jgi:crossover junction endodeoxyribonuclease RuvC